jgi:hypothetical protein
MKIGLTIGETEQHQMELSFDQKSGDLTVLMDGTRILQDSTPLANEPPKRYELSVGDLEKHRIAFQLSYRDESRGEGLPAIARLSVRAVP